MTEADFGYSERIPAEIRDAFMQLCRDVAMLQFKWHIYLELFSSQETTALLSDLAQAFFQTIEESSRNDMIMAICRLSDPSQTLGGETLSLASLVRQCSVVPRIDALLTAFQSAAGPVRLIRNRRIAHNDLEEKIRPREHLLPDIDRSRIDEIIRLASVILNGIFGHYCAADLDFQPHHKGDAKDLIYWLRAAREQHQRTVR
jgi:hypothetical protein